MQAHTHLNDNNFYVTSRPEKASLTYIDRGRGGYQNLWGPDILPTGHIYLYEEQNYHPMELVIVKVRGAFVPLPLMLSAPATCQID